MTAEKTIETVEQSFMSMLRLGPDVSLKGSPTVSPMTPDLWHSLPLPPWCPASMYFFALSQAPPELDMNTAMPKPQVVVPASRPTTPSTPSTRPVPMGDNDGQQGREDHGPERARGAEVNAALVVRLGFALHDARDLAELAPDLHDDVLGRLLHRAHGERAEDEHQHGADKEAHQHGRVGDGQVHGPAQRLLGHLDIAYQQRQSGQRGGADGKALAGGGGGIAQGV